MTNEARVPGLKVRFDEPKVEVEGEANVENEEKSLSQDVSRVILSPPETYNDKKQKTRREYQVGSMIGVSTATEKQQRQITRWYKRELKQLWNRVPSKCPSILKKGKEKKMSKPKNGKKKSRSVMLLRVRDLTVIQLIVIMFVSMLLTLGSIASIILVYQNFEMNANRVRLLEKMEKLFPDEPKPSDEKGEGKALSTELQREYGWDVKYANLVSFSILHFSSIYSIPVDVVKAVIKVESGGDPFAVSKKKCYSLMQVRYIHYDGEHKFHPWMNIRLGTKILSDGAKYGNRFLMLVAYHGIGKKRTINNPHPSSVRYAKLVMKVIKKNERTSSL